MLCVCPYVYFTFEHGFTLILLFTISKHLR